MSKDVLVIGSTGYIGSALKKHLGDLGYNVCSKRVELINQIYTHINFTDCLRYATKNKESFDTVILLSADVGGIEYTSNKQKQCLINNLQMYINFYKYIAPYCDHIIQTSSACVYGDASPIPTPERSFGFGLPNDNVLGYGFSKMALSVLGEVEEKIVTSLVLTNVYGAYNGSCESFDTNKAHVTGALVRKFCDAKANNSGVKMLGDGAATRDFVHVKDVCRAFEKAIESPYNGNLNIANGVELPIETLARKIAETLDYSGHISYDVNAPSGVNRRCLTIKKAWNQIGWDPTVNFDDGLEGLIEFYKENYG